jgi:hypothetical protein
VVVFSCLINLQEKMAVQAAHHEQLYNILSEEKNRLHQDNLSLRTELQEQAKRFAQEKVEYIEECNAELRRSEQEADARVAEQIKAISAVKAEAAAKVRLAQVFCILSCRFVIIQLLNVRHCTGKREGLYGRS